MTEPRARITALANPLGRFGHRGGYGVSWDNAFRRRRVRVRIARYSSLDVEGCSGETGGGLKLAGLIEVGTRG